MWQSLKKFWLFDDPRSYGARQILRGAVEGLKANGKEVRYYAYNPSQPDDAARLRNDLLAFQPDAVMLANHPSRLFANQVGLTSLPFTVFTWVFDDPFMMGGEPYGEDEIVLVADPSFEEGARLRGAKRVLFLPVAAPDRVTAEPCDEYRCDLSYVGSTARLKDARQSMGETFANYFDQIVDLKLKSLQAGFPDLLHSHPLNENQQIQWRGNIAYYLYTETNRKIRLMHLQPLAKIGLKLYGNDAWLDEISGTALEDCFCGSIEPFTQYPRLILSSKINLNLRSVQGFSAPTQRDFLVPVLGGFLLSSRANKPDVHWGGDLFGLKDFAWSPEIESPQHATEQVAHFLENPSKREEWVRHSQNTIQGYHTFARRMEQLGTVYDDFLSK